MGSCWICGGVADSAEHMVKSSDFRSVFGRVTQQSPVYLHTLLRKNVPIKGAGAESLKFAPSLCAYCNNTRTQPHDRAWEALSTATRQHVPPLRRNDPLPLQKAFVGKANDAMLSVHLYFVKLLGCYSVQHGVPLPLNSFAVAILGGYPYPNLFLRFFALPFVAGRANVIVDHVQAVHRGNMVVGATWSYVVGSIGVQVTYREPELTRDGVSYGWHPDDVELLLRMG